MNDNANMLLLEMQKAAESTYISDMRTLRFSMQIKNLISKIPDSAYTVEEWNEAVSYISDSPCHFQSIKEAKEGIFELK